MSDSNRVDLASPPGAPESSGHPGQWIRAAREARGQSLLHLSILLKISERRLQAFEEGRWAEVGDKTFVRALAQSLCRHLEIDAAPVLKALPPLPSEAQQPAGHGRLPDAAVPPVKNLRDPVRMPGADASRRWGSPIRIVVGLILAGALGLALAPSEWWAPPSRQSSTEPSSPLVSLQPATPPEAAASSGWPTLEPRADAASAPMQGSPGPAGSTTPSNPAAAAVQPAAPAGPVGTAATTTAATIAVSGDTASLQLRALQDTWVQVSDARGQVLVSRLLRTGERVGLEGSRPLRLRVGNVAGTEVIWLGRRVALDEQQRNNVADVELP